MEFQFNSILTTAVAVGLLVFGAQLKKRINFLEKFCIPAPVIGGFLFAIIIWVLKGANLFTISLTPSLQSPSMIFFFATIGLGGSFSLFKQGGKLLIIYLCFCWSLSLLQNLIGVGVAYAVGIDPILGIMSGAVSLEGGHGAAAAFGKTAVSMGHPSAMTVALAVATFGLIAGGLLGGPVANYLISKHNIEIPKAEFQKVELTKKEPVSSESLMKMFALILFLMFFGEQISSLFKELFKGNNVSIPGYVGAMIAALIFRNVNDQIKLIKIRESDLDILSNFALGIFLTMAMMSIKIWDLYSLALPIMIIVIVQVVFLLLLTIFVVFRCLGKDFDAAVMCSGLMGHGLGATPNAVANMTAVCEKYKSFSYKAFLIVPLSGAVLVDLVGIPIITWSVNHWG